MNKPMPRACSKNDLYRYFFELSTTDVRQTINKVVMDNRNVTEDVARKIKRLRRNEVVAVMTELGEDVG